MQVVQKCAAVVEDEVISPFLHSTSNARKEMDTLTLCLSCLTQKRERKGHAYEVISLLYLGKKT